MAAEDDRARHEPVAPRLTHRHAVAVLLHGPGRARLSGDGRVGVERGTALPVRQTREPAYGRRRAG
ncbi:hypothetical protein ABZX62_14100 [Streptomyces flavidovirens]|uniref:AraC family transcriptional regulator n=1 Tax=Streptomyces flavidovirens TaxID=67298 RepID=A0ABW6RI75_9ACTN